MLYLFIPYSIPLRKLVQLKLDPTCLIIYESETGEIIGEHSLSKEKGISAMIQPTIQRFENKTLAKVYLKSITANQPTME